MTYSETIKNSFNLINRNWQLVAVQFGMMVINFLGFFIMIGIPLGIAFIIFGLDLTGLAETRDIAGLFKDPANLVSKYLGLIMIVLASFLFYMVFATTLYLYVVGGSIGIIGRSIIEPPFRFGMKEFFAEAKKIFFPLMWFSLFMGLIFIGISFVLGLLVGGIAAIVTFAKSQDSTLALFLGIFFTLMLALIGLIIIFITLAVTTYGMAALFFKREGAIKAFNSALSFLWNNQPSFWLYVLLFAGYIAASFLMMMVTFPFKLIPIIGTIISFPLQILSYIVQSYLGLIIFASVFLFYFNSEIKKPEVLSPDPQPPGEGPEPPVDDNMQSEDISEIQAPLQVVTPPEKDEKEQS
jgi:hypothetical protein